MAPSDGSRQIERSGDHDGRCHRIHLFLRTSNLYSLNQTSTREQKTGEILLFEYGTEASELIFSVQTPQAQRIGFTGIRHATCYPNHRGHWHIYWKQSAEFPQINCYSGKRDFGEFSVHNLPTKSVLYLTRNRCTRCHVNQANGVAYIYFVPVLERALYWLIGGYSTSQKDWKMASLIYLFSGPSGLVDARSGALNAS
ncbi:uncharacterized protein [Primulina eburnea]|uniref:uncharacterized protein n=1 Tax=Primulina eburnea TaxID=1245227 RepID=UPI003C6BEB5A